MKYLKRHVSDVFVAFQGQGIYHLVGNRLVEAHIDGGAQATEDEPVGIGIPFAKRISRDSNPNHFFISYTTTRS
jgi:hypothetical protein